MFIYLFKRIGIWNIFQQCCQLPAGKQANNLYPNCWIGASKKQQLSSSIISRLRTAKHWTCVLSVRVVAWRRESPRLVKSRAWVVVEKSISHTSSFALKFDKKIQIFFVLRDFSVSLSKQNFYICICQQFGDCLFNKLKFV